MQIPAKPFIVALVAAVTFAFGAAPVMATPPAEDFAATAAAAVFPAGGSAQSLSTNVGSTSMDTLDTMEQANDIANVPHGFDVEATIALAESEIGTSRPTGWSQPGECLMSAQRWILAGGGGWTGSGTPVNNYEGATRLTLADALPGDIIQYEHLTSPHSWVSGVHTVLVTGINDDGTMQIIESNNPSRSGLVSKDESWVAHPPAGFQAVVWRF
ncbi:MAG: lipase [Leucobacter sp.]